MTEHEMVVDAYAKIAAAGIRAATAVPFLSRCIDLVMVEEPQEITALEFKLHDWRRAIEQARDHMLGADHVAICLPLDAPSAALLEAVRSEGIGLLRYTAEGTWPFEELIAPACSTVIWRPGRRWLLEAVAWREGSAQ